MKLCECGCGGAAPIATMTNAKWNHVKGEPTRFIKGHHQRKPLPKISELEAAWLAGILEGEGSFFVAARIRRPATKPPWPQWYVRVQIAMVDRDVIERVASLFGTSVTLRSVASGVRQAMWNTQVSGPRAIALMRMLRPWMGERRTKQIDAALAAPTSRPDRIFPPLSVLVDSHSEPCPKIS